MVRYRPLNPYVGRALQNEDSAKVFRCPNDRPPFMTANAKDLDPNLYKPATKAP
jgi:hypothetical protein